MNQNKPFSEKRKFFRVPLRTLVDYERNHSFLYDYTSNVGEGGMFIETEEVFQPGEQTVLQFTLPEVDHVFRMEGSVVWVHKVDSENKAVLLDQPPGVGIKSSFMDEEDVSLLRSFVKQKSL